MNEPLAGRRLVALLATENMLETYQAIFAVEINRESHWMHGVKIEVDPTIADGSFGELYADGMRRVLPCEYLQRRILDEWPTINLDEPQTVSHYFGILKPRPRHQRPLRNLRNRSV